MKAKKIIICVVSVLAAYSVSAYAQGMYFPSPNGMETAYSYSGGGFKSVVSGYSAYYGGVTASGFKTYASAAYDETKSSARGYFPDYLARASVSLGCASKVSSAEMYVRSSSDDIFRSLRETDLGVNYARDVYTDGIGGVWLFTLNYSTRRSFWKGMPVPFAAYRYASGKLFVMAPFFASYGFADNMSLSFTWRPVKYYEAALKWTKSDSFSLSLTGGSYMDEYLPAARADEDESLYLERGRAALRPEWKLFGGGVRVHVSAGWEFGGCYYTGRNYDEKHGRVGLSSGPSAGAGIKYAF